MEPRIQYAKTPDGVSIAFWTLGEGGTPVLLTSPLTWSHIAVEWEIPRLRQWYERLPADRMLVRYDIRGMGMSQRGLEDYSRDAMGSSQPRVQSPPLWRPARPGAIGGGRRTWMGDTGVRAPSPA